jgi:hypothetical protein
MEKKFIKMVDNQEIELSPAEVEQLLKEAEVSDRLYAIELAKRRRNNELVQSDWTQSLDAPFTQEKRAEWATYRQALRDVPQQSGFPDNIQWPTKPE